MTHRPRASSPGQPHEEKERGREKMASRIPSGQGRRAGVRKFEEENFSLFFMTLPQSKSHVLGTDEVLRGSTSTLMAFEGKVRNLPTEES